MQQWMLIYYVISRFTKLLVHQEHTNELYAGPQPLHIILQQQFWISWARSDICWLVYSCVICHFHRKKMTDFPSSKTILSLWSGLYWPCQHQSSDEKGLWNLERFYSYLCASS
jgi:hypothetical protein